MTLQNWNIISFFSLEIGNPGLTLDRTVRNLPGAASIIMNKNINVSAVSIKGRLLVQNCQHSCEIKLFSEAK